MNRALPLLVVAALAACAAKPDAASTTATTSTVEGALTTASFPQAPVAVEATNTQGTKVSATPAADGTFSLKLDKANTWKLDVVTANGSVPVVFPRASKKLDRDFLVKTGAAVIQLGAIRHLSAAPAEGFSVYESSAAGAEGECTDGALADGTPCVDDDQETSCEDGDQIECENGKDATGAACTDEGDADDGEVEDDADDADGECTNGLDAAGQPCTDADDDNGADGECTNGLDAAGQPCTDADEAPEADPNSEMAVPEHNAPQEVSGCAEGSSDGEEAD